MKEVFTTLLEVKNELRDLMMQHIAIAERVEESDPDAYKKEVDIVNGISASIKVVREKMYSL